MPANRSQSGHDLSPLTPAEIAERARALSAEERHIMLDHGTEPPFCGGLLAEKGTGVYLCRLCELPLFKSEAKFKSGTGWPSFFAPFDPAHIANIEDRTHGMVRTEIRCRRCGGHLGPLFNDGPRPRGQRFCLNSTALRFETGP